MSQAARLILASNNAHKLAEMGALLRPAGLELVSQGSLGIPEAEEPFATFVENALAKARHAARHGGLPAVADDSGLCVDALDGAPGVLSARYATLHGQAKSDANNNAVLLQQMDGRNDRRARFVCLLVAVRHADDPEPLIASGRWDGEILEQARGASGFGYDPLLWIPELQLSVAELDAHTKNLHSHRAKAMVSLVEQMQAVWGPGGR